MGFSPSSYLQSQGWSGPGSGLRKGSRSRPVTVAQKRTLSGIGKDRDTSFNWWEDLYSTVANNKKGKAKEESRKTVTGIHSPRAPGSLSAQSSGSSTPIQQPSASAPAFDTNLIAQAKLEAARREFYARFNRGATLGGTIDSSEEKQSAASSSSSDSKSEEEQKQSKVKKGKEGKEERKRLREERRQRKLARQAKRDAKAAKKASRTSTPASEPAASLALEAQPEQAAKKEKKRKPDGETVPGNDSSVVKSSKKRRKETDEKTDADQA